MQRETLASIALYSLIFLERVLPCLYGSVHHHLRSMVYVAKTAALSNLQQLTPDQQKEVHLDSWKKKRGFNDTISLNGKLRSSGRCYCTNSEAQAPVSC